MGKKGTKESPVVINMTELARAAKKLRENETAEGRAIEIREALIKDDFCNYKYEIVSGKAIGFTHGVVGKGVIEDDMRNAFARLNVHLAVIDDVYKHSGVQIGDIDSMHNDELALLYTVTGIKIKGGEENEAVILIGNKYLSSGARMELESPKIAIDSLSSYTWHNELREAVRMVREEVALYHFGKYTPVKVEEPEEDPKQSKIGFDKEEDEESAEVNFESGKV